VDLQGYKGMVDGGDHIQLAEWKTVSNIIHKVFYLLFVPESIFIVAVYVVRGSRVIWCWTCEVMGLNPTNGCCVPTPTQHAIRPGSVNE